MFYYLLYNSSFNKNTNLKEKAITTLIYGSVVYIFHSCHNFSLFLKVI